MKRYPILYSAGLLLLAALLSLAPTLRATAFAAEAEDAKPRVEAQFAPELVYQDRVITEDTVWRGQVLVEGAVTVAPQATLTVEPGTVVRFKKREAQVPLLVVQGRIAALGSGDAPIRFTSGFSVPAAADWQGIMLLGSEKKNVLEQCRIEGARIGIEALYSNLTLKQVRVERAQTGMRFQDALVVMESGGSGDCDTGLSFSESEATLRNLSLVGNRTGLSAVRSSIYLQDSSLAMNRSAFSGDNSRVKLQGGAVLDNGRGITLFESQGTVSGVNLARNSDYGIALTSSRIRVSGNQIVGNGGQGMLVFDALAVAWDNAIHDNTGHDVFNAGKEEFRAPGNWWGGKPPKIYDNNGLGKVMTVPQLAAPPAPP